MKKIVFVLPAIAGGGAEKVVLNLYKAMQTYADFECHILALSRHIVHGVPPEFRVHCLDQVAAVSKKGIKRLTYRRTIVDMVDQYIDKVIGKDCFVLSNMMFADKVMSLSRHKVFHIIHSPYTQSLLDGKPAYRKYFIKRNINNIYRHHPMIFVSKGALDSFTESFISPVDKYIIYNPVDELSVYRLSDVEEFNLEYDYVVHVGRFNRAKRHDRLLESFAKISSDVKLLLLGEGKLESEIKNKANKLGIAERVEFIGFKKNPYPYIKHAKALFLTSDFEGLSMVAIEAISLGVPVVTTACPGGIREVFSPGSKSLVPLNDSEKLIFAMNDVLENPEDYKNVLKKEFSNQFAAAQYEKILN